MKVGRIEQLTHTRGPWRVVDRPSRGIQIEWGGPDDDVERPVAHLRWTDGLRADVNTRVAADAQLIAAAPDMDLLLRALRAGVARWYEATGEFRFDGLMYSTGDGDWARLCRAVGREKLVDAVLKAEGRS